MKVVLTRLIDDGVQTLGVLKVYKGLKQVFECKTLELTWKDNKRNVSCIPRGDYDVNRRFSEKHGEHFILQDVENRDYILIHAANYNHQLRGCIAVGKAYFDINGDNELDVTSSRDTLEDLVKQQCLPSSFTITII